MTILNLVVMAVVLLLVKSFCLGSYSLSTTSFLLAAQVAVVLLLVKSFCQGSYNLSTTILHPVAKQLKVSLVASFSPD